MASSNDSNSSVTFYRRHCISVDVGSYSVRAMLLCLTPSNVTVISKFTTPIKVYKYGHGFYEQSGEEIWEACLKVIGQSIQEVKGEHISAISFDATCSIVFLDEEFKPVSVSKVDSSEDMSHRNVMMWQDHRAVDEANILTERKHLKLRTIGDIMSPELHPAKMLWLKKNIPSKWNKVKYILDLPDYLTLRCDCTSTATRSCCSAVCKFLLDENERILNEATYWTDFGLNEITNCEKYIGSMFYFPGEFCARIELKKLFPDFNLKEERFLRTLVATSIIDCYAGAIGVLGCTPDDKTRKVVEFENRVALISGTSACFVKFQNNKDIIYIKGMWGPYVNSIMEGFYCVEAGQSAAGSLIDHLIEDHPYTEFVKDKSCHITETLNMLASQHARILALDSVHLIANNVHIYPDFHGNRSPLADPEMTGMVSGLTLNKGMDDLLKKYVACIQSLAYSAKHIISKMQDAGHIIQEIDMCGSLSKNRLYVQTIADVTGLPVLIPDEEDCVLLGTAMLAGMVSGCYKTIHDAIKGMSGSGVLVLPSEDCKIFHDKKYKVFMMMMETQLKMRNIMNSPDNDN